MANDDIDNRDTVTGAIMRYNSPNKSRIGSTKSDGMGTLSQEYLDQGDPIENRKIERERAKLKPKGYLVHTTNSKLGLNAKDSAL